MHDQGHSPTPPGPQDAHRLAGDIARLAETTIEIPPAVDDALLAAARRTLTARRAKRRALRFAGWTAAAASLGLALWVGGSLLGPRDAVRNAALVQAPALRGDLDRSGRVDILDAFALARRLQAGEGSVESDVNGDGLIDSADVEAIALIAVRLPEGRS